MAFRISFAYLWFTNSMSFTGGTCSRYLQNVSGETGVGIFSGLNPTSSPSSNNLLKSKIFNWFIKSISPLSPILNLRLSAWDFIFLAKFFDSLYQNFDPNWAKPYLYARAACRFSKCDLVTGSFNNLLYICSKCSILYSFGFAASKRFKHFVWN